MAESRPLYLGPRIKRLRRELGLTQQAMADDISISPSYVALIERNQRPVTADLLLRLARSYRLDVTDLAGEDAEDYSRRLHEVLRDPIFGDIELPSLEIADLAGSYPGISEALLRLHGAYLREQQALAEQRAAGGAAPDTDPVAEARRFVAAHRNHFSQLEDRAEQLAAEIEADGGAQQWLGARKSTRVRFMPPDVLVDSLRRFDRHNEQLLIADNLAVTERAWELAIHIAYTAMRGEIAGIVRAETLSSQTSINLVRRALAGYGAAALLMPYERFARAAEERRYDIEALSRQFSTSFEQTAHRLTTLSKPGHDHVPFFFIRVDAAGNVSKRLDGAGYSFAAHGGGCPLWSVHSVFRTPGEVVSQWLDLPDGQRFFSIARTVSAGGGGFGKPRIDRAIALACAAEHAPRLIYAQGIEPSTAAATPIGVTCRLCDRTQCTARALPPIGREILPDDYRRAAEPFSFAES